PYLLDKIQKLTGGDSLKANIQLVFNNAKLGAQISAELCK
ncbi:MAG: pseudouridine-5'-phosphate glycosidase, partial [Synergistaceae bacterium]|nr:pseudouridine-5'-phosphate glycosidase [Synergistaceae bacterium]